MCSTVGLWVTVSVELSLSVVFPGASPPPKVIPKRLLKNAIPSSADSLTAAISASSLISSRFSALGGLVGDGLVLLKKDGTNVQFWFLNFKLYHRLPL